MNSTPFLADVQRYVDKKLSDLGIDPKTFEEADLPARRALVESAHGKTMDVSVVQDTFLSNERIERSLDSALAAPLPRLISVLGARIFRHLP